MPENQTMERRPADRDRPWGEKRSELENAERLRQRYRRIGIASVAAAADVRGNQCDAGKKGGR